VARKKSIHGRHLWVLSKEFQDDYGKTAYEHSFFFVCDCSNNPQRIDQDAFLCRKPILCERCEWMGTASWEWMRKQADPNAKEE